MRPSTPRVTHRHQRGFTLIEALVAILILSVGVLGATGLLTASMQANREARNQAAAVRLGRELGELMRANKDVAINTDTAQNPYLVTSAAVPSGTANYVTTSGTATAAQMAAWDIQQWLLEVNDALPGARIVVCFDATPYDSNGLPQWNCSQTGGNVVVKMGWNRASLASGSGASASTSNDMALAANNPPSVIMPLIAGSSQ